jgi:hypothetical protein
VRFDARYAGREWTELPALAQACDHAKLSRNQAQAARLCSAGHTYREIARELSLPYRAARRTTLKAGRLLRAAHAHLARLDREQARDLYQCMRNVAPSAPSGVRPMAPTPGGGWEPVILRARPDGACPEDLTGDLVRFLRALPRLMAEYERAAAGAA